MPHNNKILDNAACHITSVFVVIHSQSSFILAEFQFRIMQANTKPRNKIKSLWSFLIVPCNLPRELLQVPTPPDAPSDCCISFRCTAYPRSCWLWESLKYTVYILFSILYSEITARNETKDYALYALNYSNHFFFILIYKLLYLYSWIVLRE